MIAIPGLKLTGADTKDGSTAVGKGTTLLKSPTTTTSTFVSGRGHRERADSDDETGEGTDADGDDEGTDKSESDREMESESESESESDDGVPHIFRPWSFALLSVALLIGSVVSRARR